MKKLQKLTHFSRWGICIEFILGSFYINESADGEVMKHSVHLGFS